MANVFTNGRAVANAMIGGLVDAGVLANAVTRDVDSALVAGKGDTVSVRRITTGVAANFGGTASLTDMTETDVQVQLTHQPYIQTAITTKEKAFKVEDFYAQVVKPQVDGVAEYLENEIATTLEGTATTKLRATTAKGVLLAAFEYFGDTKIPTADRYLACSPTFAATLLGEDFMSAEKSADGGAAFKEAFLGRRFGFNIIVSSYITDVDSADTAAGVDPTAIAYHKSGLIFASRTPEMPEGGAIGATASAYGYGVRLINSWDNTSLSDVLTIDSLAGFKRSHDARIVPLAIAAD